MLVEVDSKVHVSAREFSEALWQTLLRLYGEAGASRASLSLIEYDDETCHAVVRVTNSASDMVRSALALVTHMGDNQAAFHVVQVSGTLKALRRKSRKLVVGNNHPQRLLG